MTRYTQVYIFIYGPYPDTQMYDLINMDGDLFYGKGR